MLEWVRSERVTHWEGSSDEWSGRSRLGASAGLEAEGSQPGMSEIPPANRSALTFLSTSSSAGLELRPFHREKNATVESSSRYTRLQSEEG